MSERFWIPLTTLTGEIGFCLSLCSNTVLLSLIHFRSHSQIGSYKYLLIFFCLFTLFYSSVEMLLRPLIHIFDDTLYLIQRKRFDWGKTVTRLVPTTYCGCYAMSFTLFALQFIHRYIATCKSHHMRFFEMPYFVGWIVGAVAVAISWASAAFFLFPQTDRTYSSFKFIMNNSYGMNPDDADYVPYKYFYYDDEGIKRPDLRNMLGVSQHLLVIMGSYSVLFFCGIKTYLTLKSFKGVSSKTRELQFQLFRALCVQTLIPMIFMYFPTGFMFACPFFGLQLGATTNYQTIVAQLYPGIDPLILIILIDRYRHTVIDLIACRFSLVMKSPGHSRIERSRSTRKTYTSDNTSHW